MKKSIFLITLLLFLFSISSIYSQILKAAAIQGSDGKDAAFYRILSERSGVDIELFFMDPPAAENALEEGRIDLAILPDNERTDRIAHIQTPLFVKTFALISKSGFFVNEHNLMDIRTVGVFMGDEPSLFRELIDKYSIEPRIQKARHYDSLIKIIGSGRVTVIFIPVKEFDRAIDRMDEDRTTFGHPFIIGHEELFLVLSRRRADRVAPLMDKLNRTIDHMKNDGTIEELDRIH